MQGAKPLGSVFFLTLSPSLALKVPPRRPPERRQPRRRRRRNRRESQWSRPNAPARAHTRGRRKGDARERRRRRHRHRRRTPSVARGPSITAHRVYVVALLYRQVLLLQQCFSPLGGVSFPTSGVRFAVGKELGPGGGEVTDAAVNCTSKRHPSRQ